MKVDSHLPAAHHGWRQQLKSPQNSGRSLPLVGRLAVGLVGPWTWLAGFVDLVDGLRAGGLPFGGRKGAGLFSQALKGGDGLVV